MDELQVGNIIKQRYELVKFLGSGSFGEVWFAHDQMTGRDVALKIYLSLDPAGIEEFQREYTNTIDLSSPFLLTPEYFDVYGRRPFLVMKYCENGSSSKLAGQMSEDKLWDFIYDVASGLETLHSQSDPIVHQDIKPDNILVDSNGRFLITDFGISKRLRTTMRRQSKRDVRSGAMPYMAPERFDANPRLSTASDIWSLGASIYELATGELPFSGFGGAMQHNGADMPSLENGYSSALNELMQRCLNLRSSQRPSAGELVDWTTHRTLPRNNSVSKAPTPDKQNTSYAQPTINEPAPKGIKRKYWVPLLAILCIAIAIIFGMKNHQENASSSPSISNELVTTSVQLVTVDTSDVNIVTQEPTNQIENKHISLDKEIIISEGYYSAKYQIHCSKGTLDVAQTISGEFNRYQLQTNPNVDLERIIAQFEGLVYFWAASEIGTNIVNENGSYSDEYMRATIRLLGKSADAFSVKRGNSPLAYEGAISRKDMLHDILTGKGDMSFDDIEIIVWGMGEHPVTTKDIKLD